MEEKQQGIGELVRWEFPQACCMAEGRSRKIHTDRDARTHTQMDNGPKYVTFLTYTSTDTLIVSLSLAHVYIGHSKYELIHLKILVFV